MIQLTKKQHEGIKATMKDGVTFILKEGGSRSGKTFEDCYYIYCRAMVYPKSKHLIFHKEYTDCKRAVILDTFPKVMELCGDDFEKHYKKQDHYLEFPNGSRIFFGGVADKEQTDKILGNEYATIIGMEARQISYETYNIVLTRLNAKDIPLKFIIETNPSSKRHWIYKKWFEFKDPTSGEDIKSKESHVRIKYLPDDNIQNISEDYINILESGSNLTRERFRHGNWVDSSENPVFDRYDPNISEVDNIPIIQSAEHVVSFDFGINDPTALLFIQLFDGKIEIIHEYENTGKIPEHYAQVIRNFENKHGIKIDNFYGDPSGANRDARLTSYIEEYNKLGIRIETPKNVSRLDMITKGNALMDNVRVSANCQKTREMFIGWEYTLRNNGTMDDIVPIHDELSHLGTAFNYFVGKRYLNKKDIIIKY